MMRGAGAETRQGETLLDLILPDADGSSSIFDNGRLLDGSKEDRFMSNSDMTPRTGCPFQRSHRAPIAMPSSSCCCM